MCPFCRIADRPGAKRLRDQRFTAVPTRTRCETCGSKTDGNDGPCASCRRAAELTEINTETAAVSGVPYVLLLSAAFILVFKRFPSLNNDGETGWEHIVPPHWLNPWLFIVGVILVGWGLTVLVIMHNDLSRWTNHAKTRRVIRNQSWFQIVAGIVLVGLAVGW